MGRILLIGLGFTFTLVGPVTTYTLFFYHVNSYESENFSRSEAMVSFVLAKLFNALSCGLWRIKIPASVLTIANDETDTVHKELNGFFLHHISFS